MGMLCNTYEKMFKVCSSCFKVPEKFNIDKNAYDFRVDKVPQVNDQMKIILTEIMD